jgi:integrase
MVWLPKHTGAFLDYAEDEKERFYPLYHLASYTGMRRSEIGGLTWPELDLDAGHASVRESKTRQGVRTIPLDTATVAVLRAWREQQDAERAIVGRAWLAGDRVFTRADGTPVPAQWISRRFETLAFRADLPPVRFHDLRHGAASLSKLGGLDSKYIRELLGHSRTAFTDDTYVLLFPEVAQAGAEATAAVVPRARRSAT